MSLKKPEELLSKAESIYFDIDYTAVKQWKESSDGGKAVGYMPIYVPRELIDAAKMLPVGLMGARGLIEIIRGDAYYQSYICQIPRSTIELALTGRYDSMDGFLFPSICDVVRNLSGMWKVLFPEKYVHYFDVPQNFDPKVGGRFYAYELRELSADLAKLAGREVTDDDIRRSIDRYNENGVAVSELMDLRATEPWRVLAHEAYLIMYAGNVLPVDEHTRYVREYCAAAKAADRPKRDNVKVVVVGAFCEQPPIDLIKALEMAGCYIVWDDMSLGRAWLKRGIETAGDPFEALATAFLEHSSETASKYEPEGDKGAYLVDIVRRTGAEGVVFAAPSFCDPALLEQPMLQDRLDKDKVPWTAFRYAENLGQFQVIREQAGTFADSIKLWSDA